MSKNKNKSYPLNSALNIDIGQLYLLLPQNACAHLQFE